MKISGIACIILGLVLISACSNNRPVLEINSLERKSLYDELPSAFKENHTGIEVRTDQQVYTLPIDEVILQIDNTGTIPIGFETDVYIEIFQNGIWYPVPYENMAFADKMNVVVPGEITEATPPIELLRYQLIEGNYRITKSFYVTEGENRQKIDLAAEFRIE